MNSTNITSDMVEGMIKEHTYDIKWLVGSENLTDACNAVRKFYQSKESNRTWTRTDIEAGFDLATVYVICEPFYQQRHTKYIFKNYKGRTIPIKQ